MYIHVSQYEVSKKIPFTRKLTVFFFLSVSFFLLDHKKIKWNFKTCMYAFFSFFQIIFCNFMLYFGALVLLGSSVDTKDSPVGLFWVGLAFPSLFVFTIVSPKCTDSKIVFSKHLLWLTVKHMKKCLEGNLLFLSEVPFGSFKGKKKKAEGIAKNWKKKRLRS